MNSDTPTIKIFSVRNDPAPFAPEFATDGSACFDIRAYLQVDSIWSSLSLNNEKKIFDGKLTMEAGEVCMIPTGLIFDIPENYVLRLHPRSGLSKKGLNLANCEGIVDSDYVEEVMILVRAYNHIQISHDDKICQGELTKAVKVCMMWVEDRPKQKTTRSGGFGSTGK